ncbi:hypothetical protein OCU04_012967 [Sclerotinia nivalis]|uniref:Uncharacterized protein n=1 Tax=Sclerotinia nivalis TaxID=352851 RepID=A0A9X0A8D4_9HELO|nr:hypothetical protein OCU04_012967 [Sclerotinia nivalis]
MSCSASPTFQVAARDDHSEHIVTRQCPLVLGLWSASNFSQQQQYPVEQQLQSALGLPTSVSNVKPPIVALTATAVGLHEGSEIRSPRPLHSKYSFFFFFFKRHLSSKWAKPCGFQGGYPNSGQHSDPGAPITSPSVQSQHGVQQYLILSPQPQRGGPNVGICSSINGLPTCRMALLFQSAVFRA